MTKRSKKPLVQRIALIRSARGCLKRKRGERPFSELWAEYKEQEREKTSDDFGESPHRVKEKGIDMAGKHKDWTREEHILAFNLYCRIQFGQIHMRNPQVVQLAKILGRSIGAVSYKLANFSRLDSELQAQGIKGMPHGARGEEEVWREFENDPESLAYESERLLAKFTGRKLEEIADIDERELPKEGIERERMVRTRVNQHFFRTAVLSAYDYKCCVTGLAIPELLVASHIIPWASDSKQRMNPRNGLCLNALHDRAFDRRLMFIAEDLTIRFREKLVKAEKRSSGLDWLLSYDGKPICEPRKFKPDPALLTAHAGL